MFYANQYSQNINIIMWLTLITEIFFFCIKYSKHTVYFHYKEHLNLDGKFSSEILDLYLDLIKFTVEKSRFIYQVISNII